MHDRNHETGREDYSEQLERQARKDAREAEINLAPVFDEMLSRMFPLAHPRKKER